MASIFELPLNLLDQLRAGQDPAKWDIVEASFISNTTIQNNPGAKPVKFLIFESVESYQAGLSQITDTGGRRKVKFQYPYRDGQTTDDLGKRPEDYEAQVIFHGAGYKDGLEAFLAEVNQPSPGVLRHPVRGDLSCALEEYEITHSADSRKSCALRVRFIEHTFNLNISQDPTLGQRTVKSTLLSALSAVKSIGTVIDRVRAAVFSVRSLKNSIIQFGLEYQFAYTRNLQSLNFTYNDSGSADLPGLLPVTQGGTLDANGQPQTTAPAIVASPFDPFANIPVGDTALFQAVATQQAIQNTNALRVQVENIIALLSGAEGGQGALIYRAEILALKQSAVDMQNVLETGIASSRARIVAFTVPRPMSVREIAFEVGLDVQRSYEIELLNPFILSCNWIDSGTMLQVPV